MDTVKPTIIALFQQLGLGQDEAAVNEFIEQNKGVPATTLLHEMPVWNNTQAEFLKHAKERDADWAEVVDELDARLR